MVKRVFGLERQIKKTNKVFRGMYGNGIKVLNHYHLYLQIGKGSYGKV